MKHVKTIVKGTLKEKKAQTGCGECQTSCQSACKTSFGRSEAFRAEIGRRRRVCGYRCIPRPDAARTAAFCFIKKTQRAVDWPEARQRRNDPCRSLRVALRQDCRKSRMAG